MLGNLFRVIIPELLNHCNWQEIELAENNWMTVYNKKEFRFDINAQCSQRARRCE